MQHERRRDRVWKQILNVAYQKGEVTLDDIDVALYETVDTRKEAEEKYGGKEGEMEEHITEEPGGRYTVLVEPDASETTKRSVLHTMSKERFAYLEKPEDSAGVWYIGPMLRALFCRDLGSDTERSRKTVTTLTKHVIGDEDLDDEEKSDIVREIVS